MKSSPLASAFGADFAARPHRREGLRGPVPHRHHIAAPDEDVALAEHHIAALAARSAQHDEQRVAIDLELRALVGDAGVLDGELVQAEAALHHGERRGVGLEEPDPDELSRRVRHLVQAAEIEVPDPDAVAVERAVHHLVHRRPLSPRDRLGAAPYHEARTRCHAA